jgi:hypothetical protein
MNTTYTVKHIQKGLTLFIKAKAHCREVGEWKTRTRGNNDE